MNIAAILALVAKGITVVETLVEAGQTAAPAFEALKNLLSSAQQGQVTDEQLAETEALLDSLIADFNTDLPED